MAQATAAAYIQTAADKMMALIDAGGGDAFAALFTDDGVVDVVKTGAHKQGAAELKGLCEFLHGKFVGNTHWEGGVCVRLQEKPDNGSRIWLNESCWRCLNPAKEDLAIGLHRDVFQEMPDGTLLCKTRTIIHLWTKEEGVIHVDPASE